MKYPTILIGTMVKNCERWLHRYWENIKKLDYPRKKIRIVFIYGNSYDDTLKIIKSIAKEKYYKVDVYKEEFSYELTAGGPHLSASVFNDWKRMLKEDYFLLLNSSMIKFNPNLIKELLNVNGDIIAPYIWMEDTKAFYDTFSFRINNSRFDALNPPGKDKNYPIEIDSVGSCFLITKDAFKEVPINNPYPNINFCIKAKELGYIIIACPYLDAYHVNYSKIGFSRAPLSPDMGLYPNRIVLKSDYPVQKATLKKRRKK